MKRIYFSILCALLSMPTLYAEEYGKLIFEDDFQREDLPGEKEQLANGWGTNSKSRAKGHKQIFFIDGAMLIKTHPEADHAASVTHPAEFRDGAVQMRFKLDDAKDMLGLDFADLSFKEVWAGHLFKVDFAASYVSINDMKTGSMNLEIRQARTSGALTAEQKQLIARTTKRLPTDIAPGKWHTLLVAITGDTVTTSVDGEEVGRFTSAGFAHPSKRMLRLAVPRSAVVDDIKIWARTPIAD